MQKEVLTPVKIAVVGCGNIVQSVHLPALRGQTDAEVVWFVDTNASNRAKVSSWHPHARLATSIQEIDVVSAVIIATPPALHYEHVKFALNKGWHVLVEKPLTTKYEQSQELVALAEQRGVQLCVNLNRRFLLQTRALEDLIRRRPFGRMKSVTVTDGGRWTGGAEGAETFHSSLGISGGGVMLDTGSHMLDLVLHLLHFPSLNSIEYADDGVTGLEAECRFSFPVKATEGEDVSLQGFFSRIAPLEQKIEIQFEKAKVRAMLPSGDLEVIGVVHTEMPLVIHVNHDEDPIIASFRASFQEFVKGCRDQRYRPVHHAVSALPALQAIQRCYRERQSLRNPWGERIGQGDRIDTKHGHRQKKIIAIIGAGGFLGSRLFKRLAMDERYSPRPIAHSSLGSFGILRYTNSVAIGDADSPGFLRDALKGADMVVNCAINMRGARRFAISSTRTIARNAARVSGEVGAKRFIQISTIAVHGNFIGRDGQALKRDPTRSTYALAKYYSEQDARKECMRGGTDSVVLRMGHIYGPYALGWTIGQRDLVRSDELTSVDGWRNPSNTVFVDNAIDAIIAAIEHPAPFDGATFYITDVPNKSWHEFYEPLFALEQRAMDRVRNLSYADVECLQGTKRRNLMRQLIGCAREIAHPVFEKQHLREVREKRAYQHLFNTIESFVPERCFRSFKRWLRQSVASSPSAYPGEELDGILFDMACVYASSVQLPVQEAVSKLGYQPSYDWHAAQRVTMQWLQSLELTQLHSHT